MSDGADTDTDGGADAGADTGAAGDARLDRDAIAALVPHQGTMCLLARVERWDDRSIVCRAGGFRDPSHPLRTRGGLLAPALIEYAAQAMAVHGALLGRAAGRPATPGYLASARGVRLAVLRLDTLPRLPGADDALRIEVVRQAGDARQILYGFEVWHGAARLAEGRAAVVLNTPPAD